MELKYDESGKICAIYLASPFDNVPNEPLEVQLITRINFDERITPNVILAALEKALSSLEQDEINNLNKIVVAPNKNGAIINFVTTRNKQ